MSLNIVGTTGTNFLLTGSANFILSTKQKIIKDTAILYRPEQLTTSELIRLKATCSLANTIANIILDPNQNSDLGAITGNGTRLQYLNNVAASPVSQSYNDQGGIITSAYEGDSSVGITGPLA
jgi:hypothetical protein